MSETNLTPVELIRWKIMTLENEVTNLTSQYSSIPDQIRHKKSQISELMKEMRSYE
jgi:hypothetical protein